MRCSRQGCNETAILHFISAKEYVCLDEQHLCEAHGREFIAHYHSIAYPIGSRSTRTHALARFDIELLVIYEHSDEQGIYLRKFGGVERFFMLIGTVEAWALSYNLKHEQSARPLTHQALGSLIVVLGGQLQDVLVDYFDETAKCYHAKLRIQHGNRLLNLDVRPTDAFNVAVVCNVPILLAQNLHVQTHNPI